MTTPLKLAVAAGLALFVWLLLPGAPEQQAPEFVPRTAAPTDEIEQAQQLEKAEAATENRVKAITAREEGMHRRTRAAERRPEASRVVRAKYAGRWRAFLETNAVVHRELIQQALDHPGEKLHCTICRGSGFVETCVLCLDHPGKCPDCSGRRVGFGTELCALCEGRGKCPLCGGWSRMPCPFCNYGVVDPKRPPPPNEIPLR